MRCGGKMTGYVVLNGGEGLEFGTAPKYSHWGFCCGDGMLTVNLFLPDPFILIIPRPTCRKTLHTKCNCKSIVKEWNNISDKFTISWNLQLNSESAIFFVLGKASVLHYCNTVSQMSSEQRRGGSRQITSEFASRTADSRTNQKFYDVISSKVIYMYII